MFLVKNLVIMFIFQDSVDSDVDRQCPQPLQLKDDPRKPQGGKPPTPATPKDQPKKPPKKPRKKTAHSLPPQME